ncbi:hypothetical protein JCM33774_89390 [Actinophytocola sp. KF-1]
MVRDRKREGWKNGRNAGLAGQGAASARLCGKAAAVARVGAAMRPQARGGKGTARASAGPPRKGTASKVVSNARWRPRASRLGDPKRQGMPARWP